MGYMHIENLYRCPEILECFALEKIHGTSAHISYKNGEIHYFAGGESHANFVQLFDSLSLPEKFAKAFSGLNVVIYGEAFGGKCQGMSATYGKCLRFMAFDVQIDGVWLDVPSAETLVVGVGLEFVPYERGPLTLAWLDEQRDKPSRVAVLPDKIREGIVIRPIKELLYIQNGSRFIAKHKRPEFRETKTQRKVEPNRASLLIEADKVAEEFVSPNRLQHILDKHPFKSEKDIGTIIRAMQEDIKREGSGEFEWTREVACAIGKKTVKMLLTRPGRV